jgi:hypothetical protein
MSVQVTLYTEGGTAKGHAMAQTTIRWGFIAEAWVQFLSAICDGGGGSTVPSKLRGCAAAQ